MSQHSRLARSAALALLVWAVSACGPRAGQGQTPPPNLDDQPKAEPEPPPEGAVAMQVAGLSEQGPSVVLSEIDGDRHVPLAVDSGQFAAIQRRLESKPPEPPLVHDLLDGMLTKLDAELIRAQIGAQDDRFTGALVIRAGAQIATIEARASDAIVLALGQKRPIYATADVLDKAGQKLVAVEIGVQDCDRLAARFLRCVDEEGRVPDQVMWRYTMRQSMVGLRDIKPDVAGDGCLVQELMLSRELGGKECFKAPAPTRRSALLLARLNSAPVVFQPQLTFRTGRTTQLGTGFLIQAPNKAGVAAVTSTHFIDMGGEKLVSVEWLDLRNGAAVAKMTRSWGKPGRGGSLDPLDLRSDYLVMPVDPVPAPVALLQLDPRPLPSVGERVWMPNKARGEDAGFGVGWVAGTVSAVAPSYIDVHLDRDPQLQSQSGSPIVSQATGQVIGILSRGGLDKGGVARIRLAPSAAIAAAMKSKARPRLRDVVGKR
jgi:bifunctional DNase/RNase